MTVYSFDPILNHTQKGLQLDSRRGEGGGGEGMDKQPTKEKEKNMDRKKSAGPSVISWKLYFKNPVMT